MASAGFPMPPPGLKKKEYGSSNKRLERGRKDLQKWQKYRASWDAVFHTARTIGTLRSLFNVFVVKLYTVCCETL